MPDDSAAELAKIANVLALILIKDQPRSAAVATLNSAGFSNKSVAGLTGSSEGSVRAMLSQARRRGSEKAEKDEVG